MVCYAQEYQGSFCEGKIKSHNVFFSFFCGITLNKLDRTNQLPTNTWNEMRSQSGWSFSNRTTNKPLNTINNNTPHCVNGGGHNQQWSNVAKGIRGKLL